MKLNIPILNNWAYFRDVLVGEAVNHPEFEKNQRVISNHVGRIDPILKLAFCSGDEIWQLGKPGNVLDYYDRPKKKWF